MGRIDDRLAEVRKQKKKALVFFLTAGFPEPDATPGIVGALERGGADIVEIGMPFSDPLADGPVIQHSSNVALKNGVTLERIFGAVRSIRSRSSIPLVLMGYVNPVMSYGAERFFTEAASAGADGVIIPELPLEESDRYGALIRAKGLSQILLVTPTTTPERIRRIDSASEGFLYCVSTTGVTGGRRTADVGEYVGRVRKEASRNPLLVGFGISTPADAAAVSHHADGVIVGSALIRQLEKSSSPADVTAWAQDFRSALDGA